MANPVPEQLNDFSRILLNLTKTVIYHFKSGMSSVYHHIASQADKDIHKKSTEKIRRLTAVLPRSGLSPAPVASLSFSHTLMWRMI